MHKLHTAAVLLALAVAQAAHASNEPRIVSADVEGSLLFIAGQNLGDKAPTLTLGEETLTLESHSPTAIVAWLPGKLRPGTYLLALRRGAGAPGLTFPVTLGAAGPQGPVGERGEQGPQGPKGDRGDKGDAGEKGDEGPRGLPGLAGADGAKGEKGDSGAAGAPGTTGQFAVSVHGAGVINVPATQETYKTVPGLTRTLTVPENAVVFVATDGGIRNTSTSSTAYSSTDVAILVDGKFADSGLRRRVECPNYTSLTQTICTWAMSGALALPAGAHTIEVVAAGSNLNGAERSADVSSSVVGSQPWNQGALTVLVLKQ